MELQAKVLQILPIQSGISKAGQPWQSQEVIVETLGNYPRKVRLKFFGDKAVPKVATLINGQIYKFSFDLESREFNGRWYTDVNVYQIHNESEQVYQTTPQPQDNPLSQDYYSQTYISQKSQSYSPPTSSPQGDDLPF